MSEGTNYDDMTVEQLQEDLQGRGIEYRSDDRKPTLISLAKGETVDRESGSRSGADAGQDEVARRLHAEQAVGYSGSVPDATPNENYTLKGAASGAQTPETDKGIGRTDQTHTGT